MSIELLNTHPIISEAMAMLMDLFNENDDKRFVLSYGAAIDHVSEPNDLDIYTDPATFEFIKGFDFEGLSLEFVETKTLPATIFMPECEVVELSYQGKPVTIHPTFDNRYLFDENVIQVKGGWYLPTAEQLIRDYVDLINVTKFDYNKLEKLVKRVGLGWTYRPENIKYLVILSQLFFNIYKTIVDRDLLKNTKWERIEMEVQRGDVVEVYHGSHLPLPVIANNPMNTVIFYCPVDSYVVHKTTLDMNTFHGDVERTQVFKVGEYLNGAKLRLESVGAFSPSDYSKPNSTKILDVKSFTALDVKRNGVFFTDDHTAERSSHFIEIIDRNLAHDIIMHCELNPSKAESILNHHLNRGIIRSDEMTVKYLDKTFITVNNCVIPLFHLSDKNNGIGYTTRLVTLSNDKEAITSVVTNADQHEIEETYVARIMEAVIVGASTNSFEKIFKLNYLMNIDPTNALIQQYGPAD